MTNVSRVCGSLLLSLVCNIGAAQQDVKIRLGPRVLRAGEHGVGELAADVAFRDLSGSELRVGRMAKDHRAVVFAISSTSCPLSKKYFPSLLTLAHKYVSRGVRFVIVNPVATDDENAMRRQQKQLGTDASYVFDRNGALTNALGAKTTTDVIVVDSARTVIYHGAIDDQYGFGYSLNAARKQYLVDALDALLDNRVPLTEATAAPGCILAIVKPQAAEEDPQPDLTYHGRISRLMQRRCVGCHRDGGVAPFPLDSYEDVASHSPMISLVVKRGIMPPWFAAKPDEGQPSPWSNDCSLTKTEKQDLLGWIEGEQAEGDVADAPKPIVFADEWEIGKPDAVFAFDEPVPVKATGFMPYMNVRIETNLTEDKWVQAVEIQPGQRTVVHHVLVFAQPPGTRGRKGAGNGVSYWAIYVPGNGAQVYPKGYARRLPKGSRLTFQMHYTTNGTATEDRTRIGMIFADSPPKHEVKTASILNEKFKIPPGAGNHRVEASISIPADVQILGYLPHHHLRGKASRYDLISEERKPELLLDVPRYDFNWQLFYKYAEPRIIKRGSSIRFTAWYDNSLDNPANPDPTRAVGWGQQTYDEMHLGYVEYTVLEDNLNKGESSRFSSFAALDTNQDGSITMTEIKVLAPDMPRRRRAEIFNQYDTDENGSLGKAEYDRLRKDLD